MAMYCLWSVVLLDFLQKIEEFVMLLDRYYSENKKNLSNSIKNIALHDIAGVVALHDDFFCEF